MEEVKKMLYAMIKKLRLERGWTQAELAKELPLNKKSIKNWESDLSKPSVDSIISLAEAFCVSTDYLLGIEKRKPIYVDHLSEKEQRRIRFLVQSYAIMLKNEAKE